MFQFWFDTVKHPDVRDIISFSREETSVYQFNLYKNNIFLSYIFY